MEANFKGMPTAGAGKRQQQQQKGSRYFDRASEIPAVRFVKPVPFITGEAEGGVGVRTESILRRALPTESSSMYSTWWPEAVEGRKSEEGGGFGFLNFWTF